MFYVSGEELDALRSGNVGLSVSFLGMCLGAFITLAVTYGTVTLPEKTAPFFFWGTVLTGILGLFFGAVTANEWVAARRRVKEIRSRPAA
jgi:uncharacterized membrane protein YjfL (UPF0719 family)